MTLGIPPAFPTVIILYKINRPIKIPVTININPILPKNFRGSKSL